MNDLELLKSLIHEGMLHHATYRNHGTLWEGLHFYAVAPDGFRGYSHAGSIHKDDPDLPAAEQLCAGITPISVGAYGRG